MSASVFVALGSNLGDREGHLLQGVADIAEIVDCSELRMSSIYETAPMGCLLYTSPSPRDRQKSRMPSSA